MSISSAKSSAHGEDFAEQNDIHATLLSIFLSVCCGLKKGLNESEPGNANASSDSKVAATQQQAPI